ncbi:MAG: AMP-binding protein [Hyphomicrobiaceae bacterium]
MADATGAPELPDTSDGFLKLFLRKAATEPERVFCRVGAGALSFGDLERRSAALAVWLQGQGVTSGDRVALMLRNSGTALALMLAIARAGAVWVPINTQAVGDNLAYTLMHSEPRVVVAESDLLPVIAACGAELRDTTIVSVDAAAAAQDAEAGDWSESALPDADAPFAIMYTSGTTGRPKGVMVSHRMLRLSGEAAAIVSAAVDGDVLYLWEPLFHIGGTQMIVMPLIREVTLVLAERFSASRFWNEVADCGATHMHFLGGILQILLKQPPGPLDKSHPVRIAWGGGCPIDVWRAFEARFGVEIRECYGMTECSSFTTANLNGALGSIGTPLPWFDVAIVDAAGRPVATGERGEIVVRERLAGALTRGYFKDPETTAKALRGGAFHTGDLGSRDAERNMYFHGRVTESVRVRGENVTAAEVEEVVRQHPAVEDCVVIGVAAEVGEQEIKLFVLAKAGGAVVPAELSAWLASRLARYQRPRYIAVVDAFERTPSQRIMKHKLSKRTDDAWDAMA